MKNIIIGAIIGCMVGFLLHYLYISAMCIYIDVDSYKIKGIAEIVYYLSQPFIALGTFMAVIVALFGSEIKNRIFSPKCVTSIVNNRFVEELDDDTLDETPKAQQYTCTLRIENNGNRELNQLELVIDEIQYSENREKNYKRINKIDKTTLYWGKEGEKSISLREKERRELVVARILPKSYSSTPDKSNESPARFEIYGYKLDGRKACKGVWRVKYHLQTSNKIISDFEIKFSWDGSWHSRETEMLSSSSVEFKELKR